MIVSTSLKLQKFIKNLIYVKFSDFFPGGVAVVFDGLVQGCFSERLISRRHY